MDGAFTVPDEFLFSALRSLFCTEKLKLEPSALAGFYGLRHSTAGRFGTGPSLPGATHLIWATGGALVPPEEREAW